MMTKLLFLIINDLSKSNKKDQISSPVLYHAEKATEVFQSNNITRTRTWRKKLFESFKAKEESSPPHAIHFEAFTYTQHIYKNNNNCSSSRSKHTHRERSPEKRSKDRNLVATEIRKKEKERKLINIRTLLYLGTLIRNTQQQKGITKRKRPNEGQ